MNGIYFFILALFVPHILNSQEVPYCHTKEVAPFYLTPCKDSLLLTLDENFDHEARFSSRWNKWKGVPRNHALDLYHAWYSPKNVLLKEGNLNIIGNERDVNKIESFQVGWKPKVFFDTTFSYQTGEIWSKKKYFYGRYEIRFRTPAQKGFKNAFWLFEGNKWSELDFFELDGHNPNTFTSNVHLEEILNQTLYNCYHDSLFHDSFGNWHELVINYNFDKIEWILDGDTIRVHYRYFDDLGNPVSCDMAQNKMVRSRHRSFPDEPMHLIIGQPIYTGKRAPDPDHTIFPDTFIIDYVRIYENEMCLYPNSLIVDESMTISGKHEYQNILVKDNMTLNIDDASLFMGEFGKIELGRNARLNISNSIIDSGCGYWLGIIAKNENIRITIDDYAEISNAQIGIDASISGTKGLRKNPVIQVNTSFFVNCYIGINLGVGKSHSSISNSIFSHNNKGIILRKSEGLKIVNSYFLSNDVPVESKDSDFKMHD